MPLKGEEKKGFYFSFSTGVVQGAQRAPTESSPSIEPSIEGVTLDGKKVTLSPKEKGFRFLKDFDPSLSVPVELLSSEALREELRRLSSVKSKPKQRIKKKVQKEKDIEELKRMIVSGEL